MNIVTINSENLDREHICCANSKGKEKNLGLACRKAWMQKQFEKGLTFKKMDVNGKVFIEYIPAENAWCPIKAPGYLFIKCFWVSGQYKGKGYAKELLEECIKDAKAQGKLVLVTLSSSAKKPFLSDPKYLKNKGFVVGDTANPYFKLLYLPFETDAPKPVFLDCCKEGVLPENGFVLCYSAQCPFCEEYALLIENTAREKNIAMKLIKFTELSQAQAAASPFTTYSLYYNGRFLTHEIQSVSKFLKLMEAVL